jgi:RNA polymerase sigma-70 factor (ECF subfamily)
MDYSEFTDQDLVGRARTGDERAFRHLVKRNVRPVLAVAWEFTETLEDAEDIVQEAFRRTVKVLDHFDTTRSFKSWFFTILRNVARTHAAVEGRGLLEALEESVPDLQPSPLEQVERLQLQARVDLELEKLSDMQRACFRVVQPERRLVRRDLQSRLECLDPLRQLSCLR